MPIKQTFHKLSVLPLSVITSKSVFAEFIVGFHIRWVAHSAGEDRFEALNKGGDSGDVMALHRF